MSSEKMHIKHEEGHKEVLEEIEKAEGHHQYSDIFDLVERDLDREMEIIQKALKAEADADEANLIALEAIKNAKQRSRE